MHRNRTPTTSKAPAPSPRAASWPDVLLADASEDTHQREMVSLLRSVGWVVYTLSQGYRKAKGGTRMTPGIPDVYAFHPAKRLTLWVEVKPPKEAERLAKILARTGPLPKSLVKDRKRAEAQSAFRRHCETTGQPYCYGTLPDLLACLRGLGFGL